MEQNSKEYIRLAADLQSDSIVDGPGLRTVIWTQGCAHHCKGCQNEQTWDFNGGGLVPIPMVLEAIDELECQTGITFSGGDPMFQPSACNMIAKYAKEQGLDVWCYTGFTYEKLISMNNPLIKEFLSNIDVLVDGPFILEERNLDLLFRGSNNQRLIDMKKTLENGELSLLDENIYKEVKLSTKEFEKVPLFI